MDDTQGESRSRGHGHPAAMLDALRRHLNHLGVAREHRPDRVAGSSQGFEIDSLVEGEFRETEAGTCFETVRVFPPDTFHGPAPLAEWTALSPETVARVGDDESLASVAPDRLVFLDTETTGLGGGALAFLVGVGFFNEGGDFEVHQFFLHDLSGERAMLSLLHDLLPPEGGLVTFNGRAFDVPLLTDRYIRSRVPALLHALPHLDLLPPARRLWRRRLPSCALSSLEQHILGLRREAADVPGYLIPRLYREYLHTGDARQMVRVFYHNEQDLLSMVTLGLTICRRFEQPEGEMPVEDRLSLARWYERRGMMAACEAAYRAALAGASDKGSQYDALRGLASLLKRTDRRAEAVPYWALLAALRRDVLGHEELAKYYEWQVGDLVSALEWTEAGIAVAESWSPGFRRAAALTALYHRRERLLRRLGNAGDRP